MNNFNIKNKDVKRGVNPFKTKVMVPLDENFLKIELKNGRIPNHIEYKGELYQIKKVGIVDNEKSYVPDSKFYKLISKINKKIIKKAGVNFFIKLTKINSKLDILSAKLFLLASSAGIGTGGFIFGSAGYYLYLGKSPEQYKEFLNTMLFSRISIEPEYAIATVTLLYSYKKIKETVDLIQRVMVNDAEDELKKRYPDKKLRIMEIIEKFKKSDEEERTANKGAEITLSIGLSFLGPFKGFITPIIMAIIGAKNNIKYEKKQMKSIEELGEVLKEETI